MIIRKKSIHWLAKQIEFFRIQESKILVNLAIIDERCQIHQFPFQKTVKYQFSTQKTPQNTKIFISENSLTIAIEDAKTKEQLERVLSKYIEFFNHIHRTVLLGKVTKYPFDKDEELNIQVVEEIRINWKYDFPSPSSHNSRAIANIISYMARRKKLHGLDEEFSAINLFELAKFLNPKEFVMTINGLLKLNLIEKVKKNQPRFTLQEFVVQNIKDAFTPDLLVSMWFNILKYEKSSQKINDFFANLLKAKHFKNNLIDYMQILFCYVNSQGKRSVDLTYPVTAYPTKIPHGKGYMGAQELSVMYEQLAQIKKIRDIYFSEDFNQLLESCYQRIMTEKNIPLRNVANVLFYLIQYENPTSKILESTFHQYYTVLKNECNLLDKHEPGRKFKANVDPISFVSLFSQLLEYYHADNTYLYEITSIVLKYLEKIIQHKILSDYNEKTFVRLFGVLQLAQKMYIVRNPGKNLEINVLTKNAIQKEIEKRNFSEVVSLTKLMGFASKFDIRSKNICFKFKFLIGLVPQYNEFFQTCQEKLKDPCIISKNCKNCKNCFSKS